jgi:16S rRNA (cytosine967-C5)-methyltransferase
VGKERLEKMLAANNETPDTVIQVNTLKITASELEALLEEEGVTVQKHPWMENCLVLRGTGDLEQLQSFEKGLYYVQDPAAKLSVLCAELPKKELRVLDCCAAPGGKSFAAAIAMGGLGTLHSCDVHPHKTKLIENGANRLGISNLMTFLQDGTQPHEGWEESMDAVICDVPCSGYGIIRKKPDIRYKDPDTMRDLPALQRQILEQQAKYVRPGGVLIYSTCTLVWEENEGIVKAFLEDHPEYTLEPLPLPEPFETNETGMLALIPGEYDTDGFFIARLRRML